VTAVYRILVSRPRGARYDLGWRQFYDETVDSMPMNFWWQYYADELLVAVLYGSVRTDQ
jgi:hypothetical protein